MSLKTNQTLPRVTTSVGAQWCAESQAVTASGITLAALSATPRRLSALVECSKQLLSQAPELAQPMIERNVRQAIGYAVDVGCLVGIGGPEPIGILNDDNVSAPVTFCGAGTLRTHARSRKRLATISQSRGRAHLLQAFRPATNGGKSKNGRALQRHCGTTKTESSRIRPLQRQQSPTPTVG